MNSELNAFTDAISGQCRDYRSPSADDSAVSLEHSFVVVPIFRTDSSGLAGDGDSNRDVDGAIRISPREQATEAVLGYRVWGVGWASG